MMWNRVFSSGGQQSAFLLGNPLRQRSRNPENRIRLTSRVGCNLLQHHLDSICSQIVSEFSNDQILDAPEADTEMHRCVVPDTCKKAIYPSLIVLSHHMHHEELPKENSLSNSPYQKCVLDKKHRLFIFGDTLLLLKKIKS